MKGLLQKISTPISTLRKLIRMDPDAVSEKRNTGTNRELVHVEKGEKILRRSISPLDLRAMVMSDQ